MSKSFCYGKITYKCTPALMVCIFAIYYDVLQCKFQAFDNLRH